MRILWLINHTSLRSFEIEQLRSCGAVEIYAPKSFPYDEGNLSASVDASLDETLSVPPDSLRVLNQQDWYTGASDEAWRIVNQYFDIAFIAFFPKQIDSVIANFRGAVVLRAFGLSRSLTYTELLQDLCGPDILPRLRALGDRFWFAAGYRHLPDVEGDFLKSRSVFMPVGLKLDPRKADIWEGNNPRLMFVCPRIRTSAYFRGIYDEFIQNFGDLPYTVGGAQPIRVPDKNVIGFVSREQHDRNMRELRVMFYHSQEPNHIHYHQFEAIHAGMPLIYMAGGVLDRFGDESQPGRARTVRDARRKIVRILNGDRQFTDRVRREQIALLTGIGVDDCAPAWRSAFFTITRGLQRQVQIEASQQAQARGRSLRIAIIIPERFRGGTLRGALTLANLLAAGSRAAGDDAQFVLGHLDDSSIYNEASFAGLSETVQRRPYTWTHLGKEQVQNVSRYLGMTDSKAGGPPDALGNEPMIAPDDGMAQFMDCDLWIIVSDRVYGNLLPVRPYIVLVFDYLQRYESFLSNELNNHYLKLAMRARRVLVTTKFTYDNALNYVGLEADRVRLVPWVAPDFSKNRYVSTGVPYNAKNKPYFLWTTNAAKHKNHYNAVAALAIYYQALAGALDCKVSGVESNKIFSGESPHISGVHEMLRQSPLLRSRLHVLGELSDTSYLHQLANASFLWHPARIDNGTFSVVEAAYYDVPSLSSDYPAMREIDRQYQLNLQWMSAESPELMAEALKAMEERCIQLKASVPSVLSLQSHHSEAVAAQYWIAVRECL